VAHPGDDLVFVLGNRRDFPGPISDLLGCFARARLVDSTRPTAERPEVPTRRIWVLEDWLGNWPGSTGGEVWHSSTRPSP
jgi:hypothetical protein